MVSGYLGWNWFEKQLTSRRVAIVSLLARLFQNDVMCKSLINDTPIALSTKINLMTGFWSEWRLLISRKMKQKTPKHKVFGLRQKFSTISNLAFHFWWNVEKNKIYCWERKTFSRGYGTCFMLRPPAPILL